MPKTAAELQAKVNQLDIPLLGKIIAECLAEIKGHDPTSYIQPQLNGMKAYIKFLCEGLENPPVNVSKTFFEENILLFFHALQDLGDNYHLKFPSLLKTKAEKHKLELSDKEITPWYIPSPQWDYVLLRLNNYLPANGATTAATADMKDIINFGGTHDPSRLFYFQDKMGFPSEEAFLTQFIIKTLHTIFQRTHHSDSKGNPSLPLAEWQAYSVHCAKTLNPLLERARLKIQEKQMANKLALAKNDVRTTTASTAMAKYSSKNTTTTAAAKDPTVTAVADVKDTKTEPRKAYTPHNNEIYRNLLESILDGTGDYLESLPNEEKPLPTTQSKTPDIKTTEDQEKNKLLATAIVNVSAKLMHVEELAGIIPILFYGALLKHAEKNISTRHLLTKIATRLQAKYNYLELNMWPLNIINFSLQKFKSVNMDQYYYEEIELLLPLDFFPEKNNSFTLLSRLLNWNYEVYKPHGILISIANMFDTIQTHTNPEQFSIMLEHKLNEKLLYVIMRENYWRQAPPSNSNIYRKTFDPDMVYWKIAHIVHAIAYIERYNMVVSASAAAVAALALPAASAPVASAPVAAASDIKTVQVVVAAPTTSAAAAPTAEQQIEGAITLTTSAAAPVSVVVVPPTTLPGIELQQIEGATTTNASAAAVQAEQYKFPSLFPALPSMAPSAKESQLAASVVAMPIPNALNSATAAAQTPAAAAPARVEEQPGAVEGAQEIVAPEPAAAQPRALVWG